MHLRPSAAAESGARRRAGRSGRAGLAGLGVLLLVLLGLLGMHGLAGGAAASQGASHVALHGAPHVAGQAPSAAAAHGAVAGGQGAGAPAQDGAPAESPSHQHVLDLCLAVLAGLLALAALLADPARLRAGLPARRPVRQRPLSARRPVPDLLLLQVCRT